MSKNKATLTFGNQSVELPIYAPTLGNDVIDVKSLGNYQHFTFDPGFYATAACESKITYIDGGKGILLYRGYPIDQLAAQCDYLEVCFLLMYGELPTAEEKSALNAKIKNAGVLDELIISFFKGFPQDSHPMGMLVGVVGALSTYYHEALDMSKAEDREMAAIHLIAKMPLIAAMAYRHTKGLPFIAPNHDLSYAENFLHMMFGADSEVTKHPALAKAMDTIFILQADHEQNASTSTVRMAGSTGANPFAAISAGISALWGAAHGGANEACLNMLNLIGDESQITNYIEKSKDKNDPFRLMGFGHRVYKSYDPRAKVMQKTCHDILEVVGAADEPLFKLATKLEEIALQDAYFIDKKLYPNVDFYSGITQSAIGIPTNMFTAIFALARTVGWASHWMEMMNDPDHKLYRPRQLYTGSKQRDLPKDK